MLKLTVDHIIERIQRSHPSMVLDRNEVAAWCFEAMEEAAAYDNLEEALGIALPVNDRMATLPKNIIRLLRVRGGCGTCPDVEYTVKNGCVHICSDLEQIHVDMLLIPVGEDGFPLIDDGFAKAAAAYIVDKKLYEPSLMGTIRPDAYDRVHREWLIARNESRSSMRNMTIDELSRIARHLQSPVRFNPFRR